MKTKVLFVDDDTTLGNSLVLAMEEKKEYALHYQTSLLGIESIILQWKPDVIVLDVEIGNENGIDAISTIKRIAPDIPIIFESSHTDYKYLESAIKKGGKIYLKKPFEAEELMLYIQKYTQKEESADVTFSSIKINWDNRTLSYKNGMTHKLTPMEADLLKILIANVNNPVTRNMIIKILWRGKEPSSSEQSINNYIGKLRKYLMEDNNISIESIPQLGYQLKLINEKSMK